MGLFALRTWHVPTISFKINEENFVFPLVFPSIYTTFAGKREIKELT
jgi:hypothetical protein